MYDWEILSIRTMILKHLDTQNLTHLDSRLRVNPKHSDTWQ